MVILRIHCFELLKKNYSVNQMTFLMSLPRHNIGGDRYLSHGKAPFHALSIRSDCRIGGEPKPFHIYIATRLFQAVFRIRLKLRKDGLKEASERLQLTGAIFLNGKAARALCPKQIFRCFLKRSLWLAPLQRGVSLLKFYCLELLIRNTHVK